jgi:hypothetical protein
MSKRSNFERKERDYYSTPLSAIIPLTFHLPENLIYCEPCAGEGILIQNLKKLRADIICNVAFDIYPQNSNIIKKSATDIIDNDIKNIDQFITNPPFKWEMFKPIANNLISLKPTWFLLPADFMHNIRMSTFMKKCSLVVSIGRIKWFEDTKSTSTDNFCWYLFDKNNNSHTQFIGR